MIGLMLDVTEKNSIQYRLKESEEKYRSMMESMNDAVYICAQDLTISYMNPKMIERIGYDATGRKCHEALHDLEEPCSWCTFSRVRSGEITETEVRSPKDGNHYLVTNSPIYHQDGSTSKMTIYRDITRRIMMEKELLMAKKLEAAGVFAGGIAHDYNNLLFVILGNILLLKNNFSRSSPSYKLLRTAEEAAQKTASLTKRLLAFTRDEPLAFEKSAIDGLLKEMIEKNEEKEKYPINLLISDTPLSAYVDGGLIAIVLNNILKNCKDAMENGGTIFVRAARVIVDETSELVRSRIIDNPGGYIRIAFTDHGSGIDERIRPHIFDPYFSTKRRGAEKGLGLGLSIGYSIIKKHNGALLVETKPGAGTTVSVYLPVSDPSSLKKII
jgi:PAS domain S-box-containing protein